MRSISFSNEMKKKSLACTSKSHATMGDTHRSKLHQQNLTTNASMPKHRTLVVFFVIQCHHLVQWLVKGDIQETSHHCQTFWNVLPEMRKTWPEVLRLKDPKVQKVQNIMHRYIQVCTVCTTLVNLTRVQRHNHCNRHLLCHWKPP